MEVKCKTKDTLDLYELTEFQGNLKERTNDGHGRIRALNRMAARGELLLL